MSVNTPEFRTLLFEKREPSIGMVTMNRPDQLNAINVEMLEDFEKLFEELSRDDSIRVLVITG
ncbi:MAG: enoyl-CoA hydratase/isomerase family protein, partial [Deltaproteobacteria bacterium]|nr:enoyl-CoA hydratase/isomerase family protein [Deltaproteobacteria bacterium]